ncbi:MAG TPA: GNAT family N-acetyltransferase [Longimicrobium sp.]|nr:GNAT family N-acetyltransferase [Longimicrobium sp.]
MTPFPIREAIADDIPALVRVHVTAWNATYPWYRSPPTHELRERQWRAAFRENAADWFCFVVQREDGELVGFAQANGYAEPDQPDYGGELNKIYLLREYQRRGLGRRLMGRVARRFLDQGITSMLLFADAGNPSCAFYEALGGEKLVAPDGTVADANYGWRDLRRLADACPVESA